MQNILEHLKDQPKFVNCDFSKDPHKESYRNLLELVSEESKIRHAIPLEFGYIKELGSLTSAALASFLFFKIKERIPSNKKLKYSNGWIPVHANDLGKRIGVSRQTVSRELKNLEKEKWISTCQIKNQRIVVNSKEYNKPTMVFLHLDKFLRHKYKTTGSNLIPINNERRANDIHILTDGIEEKYLSEEVNMENILTLLEDSVQCEGKLIVHFNSDCNSAIKAASNLDICEITRDSDENPEFDTPAQNEHTQIHESNLDICHKSILDRGASNLDTAFCSIVQSTPAQTDQLYVAKKERKSVRLKLKEVSKKPPKSPLDVFNENESLDNNKNLEQINPLVKEIESLENKFNKNSLDKENPFEPLLVNNHMNTLERIITMKDETDGQTPCHPDSVSGTVIPFVRRQNPLTNIEHSLDNWALLSPSERIDVKIEAMTNAMLFMMQQQLARDNEKRLGQMQNNSISLPKKERIELMTRKRPSCSNPKPVCESKDLNHAPLADQIINAWESTTKDIKVFKTVRKDKKAKPYNNVCEAVKILEGKGFTLAQAQSVFNKLVEVSKNPLGTIFMSAWFKSGKGKISIEHLFIDKNKQDSSMPMQMMGIKGYPIEVAIRNEAEFLGALKMKKKDVSATSEVPANHKEEAHMVKLGILPNPEFEGKKAILHKNIKSVIYDWEDRDLSEDEKSKAIINFYRTFYQFTEENLVNIIGKKIIVNNVGIFDSEELKQNTDEACTVFLLLFVNHGLLMKNHIESSYEDRVVYHELFKPSVLKEKIKHLININAKILR